jgi:hypothetical protein
MTAGRVEVTEDGISADGPETSMFVPPGHYYSPVPDLREVRRDEVRIFENVPRDLPGVELNESEQLALLDRFVGLYEEMPFGAHKTEGMRYFFENPSYSYSDAIMLYCMIRHLEPKRIIEIGSGYSSCVVLDTNERFFEGSISTTFIEPFPDLLMSLVTEEDRGRIDVIPSRLQEVELEQFRELEANDILFIDSTHVSRVGSDVNREIFDILPALAPGVNVHFHDVFFPFEYPKEWIYSGISWTEDYLLRAFLMYSSQFQVVLMNTFMERFHEDFFRENMPLCLANPGGSIWVRRI